tara:strand:+ start:1602 stop:2585 length:984 start_codon:yes stop_codon:yes gene_type:complete
MRYLVTGGLGFIGSHFIECLLNDLNTEFVLNIDSGSYAANKNFKPRDARYDLLLADIGDSFKIKRISNDLSFDVVVNFASHSHVDKSILNPNEFIDNNVKSFFNFLEACRYWKNKNQFKKFVHISTDEVFGDLTDSNEESFSEDSQFKPSSAYSASKAAQEMFLHSARKMHSLPVNILRLCNNFGPRQFEEKFIPTVIKNILSQQEVPVYGDGNQVREWIYVKDACEKIKSVCLNLDDFNDYGIGSGECKSNLEVVHQVNNLVHGSKTPKISFVKDRLGHDRKYKLDSSKFYLNYKKFDRGFNEGLKATVQHFICEEALSHLSNAEA